MKSLIWVAALVTSALVAGCGGDGNAGAPLFGDGGCSGAASSASCTTAANTIDVIASSVEVGSGGDTVTISAVVKDSGNVGLPGVGIVFNTNSGILTQPTVTTNASGVATVTFSAGADRSNRTATDHGHFGQSEGHHCCRHRRHQAGLSGHHRPCRWERSRHAADQGNGLEGRHHREPADHGGEQPRQRPFGHVPDDGYAGHCHRQLHGHQCRHRFPGVQRRRHLEDGDDPDQLVAVRVRVAGARYDVPVNSTQAVTVDYKIAGVPQAGQVINFSTTSGVVTPASATTNGAGQASVVISATTAGPGTIQATVQGAAAQASLSVNYVALAPARLVLQVSPTAIGPNASGLHHATDPGARHRHRCQREPGCQRHRRLHRVVDPSGGTLSQPSAVTDSSGQASVQYISGAGTTADGGIQLRASVLTNPTVFGDATMTVTQSALFIGLGTGNVIENLDPQTYKKNWVVYVTDSNGVAVANKDLTIKVLPVEYRKGHLVFDTAWVYDFRDPAHLRERGYRLHGQSNSTPGKDFNGDGDLQPGNVIRITTAQTPNAAATGIARTDSTGQATITLLYAESYVPWVKVRLTAQATVSGTESSTAQEFYVPGLAADFTSATNPTRRDDQPVRRQPLQRAELIGCRDRQPGRTSGRRQEHGRSAAGEAPGCPVHRLRFGPRATDR